MIDIEREKLLTMKEAAAGMLTLHRQPGQSTVWRWCTRGTAVAPGQRIRLDSIKINGHLYTSREAIQRWSKACQEARLQAYATPEEVSVEQSQRASVAMQEWDRRRGRGASAQPSVRP